MEFLVRLDQFEGPLDLMLHLIAKNKLDLMDLNLDILADQYVSYILEMEELKLDIASEYLAEFTWLLEYKSRRLLPRPVMEVDDNYEEDQKENLTRRLIEYQKYKEAAALLENRASAREMCLNRPRDSLVEQWSQPVIEGNARGSTYRLIQAMRKVIARQSMLNPYQTSVEVKELSVEERMKQIEEFMPYMKEQNTLSDFCRDIYGLRAVIVTFLAILELIHVQKATCMEDEKGEFWICPLTHM